MRARTSPDRASGSVSDLCDLGFAEGSRLKLRPHEQRCRAKSEDVLGFSGRTANGDFLHLQHFAGKRGNFPMHGEGEAFRCAGRKADACTGGGAEADDPLGANARELCCFLRRCEQNAAVYLRRFTLPIRRNDQHGAAEFFPGRRPQQTAGAARGNREQKRKKLSVRFQYSRCMHVCRLPVARATCIFCVCGVK